MDYQKCFSVVTAGNGYNSLKILPVWQDAAHPQSSRQESRQTPHFQGCPLGQVSILYSYTCLYSVIIDVTARGIPQQFRAKEPLAGLHKPTLLGDRSIQEFNSTSLGEQQHPLVCTWLLTATREGRDNGFPCCSMDNIIRSVIISSLRAGDATCWAGAHPPRSSRRVLHMRQTAWHMALADALQTLLARSLHHERQACRE